jgi:hypothetical protein
MCFLWSTNWLIYPSRRHSSYSPPWILKSYIARGCSASFLWCTNPTTPCSVIISYEGVPLRSAPIDVMAVGFKWRHTCLSVGWMSNGKRQTHCPIEPCTFLSSITKISVAVSSVNRAQANLTVKPDYFCSPWKRVPVFPNRYYWRSIAASLHLLISQTKGTCKVWGFHGGDHEDCRLLGCYAVWLL